MREIKFRGWNQKHKIMVEVALIDFLEKLVHLGSFQYSTEKVHLMQYTGLKDKNGKEIYEGDVIKCPELYETQESTHKTYITTGHIIFEEGAWHFSDGGLVYEEYESYDGDFEVIGNIYENPELIEVSA